MRWSVGYDDWCFTVWYVLRNVIIFIIIVLVVWLLSCGRNGLSKAKVLLGIWAAVVRVRIVIFEMVSVTIDITIAALQITE